MSDITTEPHDGARRQGVDLSKECAVGMNKHDTDGMKNGSSSNVCVGISAQAVHSIS